MKQSIFTVTENAPLTSAVYRMRLAGDTKDVAAPGQFVNIRLEGLYLRRPISVCDAVDGCLTLIYKAVGRGTERMASMRPGERLDILTGLGNGYSLEGSGDHPLLLGGGVGVPPLYLLAKRLIAQGKQPQAVLGFNTAGEAFYAEEFDALGCRVTLVTADGSLGARGFVTDALPNDYTYYYACGPLPMLKAVYRACKGSGQFSLEERMGCGFGACMGCSIQTADGPRRVCKDGPVFNKEALLWND
ncbi:MAG: dihydroorotate dehydrogenase electron transfer subunit [Clostridia bacterium]|nr:dihydroorotate dehydrogenase electron transfer subunit [Clostridia bacterium]